MTGNQQRISRRHQYLTVEIRKMAELYQDHTAPEIAKIMGLPVMSVTSALDRHGIKKTPEQLSAVIRRTRKPRRRIYSPMAAAVLRASECIQNGDNDQALTHLNNALKAKGSA